MKSKRVLPEKRWIILGIPVLFIVGSFMHFLYELSGENVVVALLVVLPIILWWSLYYIVKGENYNIDKNKWFTSALISLLVALISIPLLFYFYTGAFGVESVVVDILILFISIAFGQLLALHYYNYGDGINYIIPILIMIFIVCIFMYFTFNPPHLPIFMDSQTGQYGI